MAKKLTKKTWGIAIIVILIIAIVIWFVFSGKRTPEATPKAPKQEVVLSTVKMQTTTRELHAIGQVIAPYSVMIKSEISADVKSIKVRAGEHVKRGQVLIELINVSQKSAVNKTKALLFGLQATYKRALKIKQQNPGAITADNLDQQLSKINAAKAELVSAKEDLSNTIIRAPFAGTVGNLQTIASDDPQENSSQIAPGTYLTEGASILMLTDANHLLIQYPLPQASMKALKIGQKVLVIDALSDTQNPPAQGKVVYISPQVNASTQTLTLRAEIQSSPQIKAGMNAYVTQLLNPESLLLVPGLSLSPSITGYSVYQVEKGKLKKQAVTVGQRYDANVVILSGLKAGDKIVTSNNSNFSEGMAITVAGAKAKTKPHTDKKSKTDKKGH